MHHATFQPSCYCPVTQRRQQAILNNLEKYNKICTKNSEHNTWMHCSNRVWLTMVKISTSHHNIAIFLLLWKLSVNCKQLVLAGEVHQKVDWMWLANVLVVFGQPAVKCNTECTRNNVLLLCAHVMQCPIPVRRQYNIYNVGLWAITNNCIPYSINKKLYCLWPITKVLNRSFLITHTHTHTHTCIHIPT